MTQQQVDPWKFMALVAQCAADAQIEVERAFRFMAALTVAMQTQKAASADPPPMPPSSSVQ